MVAKEFGIPVQFQRFWLWAKCQNHTYRPNHPLIPMKETQHVGQLREVSNKAHYFIMQNSSCSWILAWKGD
ncbi:putative ubiquitinyl hydrolase 1 [Rosa chinensis]|uniref:Putative ubiquitinyl hydrolase 1 n=1 Tax=Rosa chinensis TaxID=74649 RepID=A0A2P6S9R5_ROSCH|nr:putative ubiquitinyl hydrolase 1 [Rosa chinensis]